MGGISSYDIAQHYQRMQILTASHPKAICMLHEKAVSLLHRVRIEPQRRRELLDRVQNILAQLQTALSGNDTVSHSLFLLYDYCYVLLERGERGDCRNVERIMTILGSTFFYLLRHG